MAAVATMVGPPCGNWRVRPGGLIGACLVLDAPLVAATVAAAAAAVAAAVAANGVHFACVTDCVIFAAAQSTWEGGDRVGTRPPRLPNIFVRGNDGIQSMPDGGITVSTRVPPPLMMFCGLPPWYVLAVVGGELVVSMSYSVCQ